MRTLAACILAAMLLTCGARALELPAALTGHIPQEVQELDSAALIDGGGRLLAERAAELLRSIAGHELRGMALLLLVPLLCGMAEGFSSGEDGIPYCVNMVGVLAILLLASDDLTGLITLGTQTMDELRTLSNVLLPTVAAALAMGGFVGSAGILQVGTLFASDFLLRMIHELLLPLTYCYIALAAAAATLPESRLGALSAGLRRLIGAALCGMMLLFTLYLTIGNIMSGSVDKAALKTAKTAMSAAIPVVGGILSEAAEAVLSGAAAVRSVCGIAGILTVLLISLSPLLRLSVQYLLYQMAAVLASVMGSEALDRFIRDLGSAFGLLLGMTGACSLLLLVSLLLSITMVVP